MFKVDNTNTRERCEICSKLTIKTPERCNWHRFGLFIVTLNIFHTFFYCFYCYFEQVNVSWEGAILQLANLQNNWLYAEVINRSFHWNFQNSYFQCIFKKNKKKTVYKKSTLTLLKIKINFWNCMFLSCHVRVSEWIHTL